MVQRKLSKRKKKCLVKALAEASDGNHMSALLLFTVYITAVSNSSVQDRSSADCCANTRSSARKSSKSDFFGKWTLVSQLWWPQGLSAPAVSLPWGLSLLPQQDCVTLPHLQSPSFALASWNWAMKWPEAVLPGRGTSWVLGGLHSCHKICPVTSGRSLEWASVICSESLLLVFCMFASFIQAKKLPSKSILSSPSHWFLCSILRRIWRKERKAAFLLQRDALYCKGQVDSVSKQCQEAATVVGGWKEEEKERQVVLGRLTSMWGREQEDWTLLEKYWETVDSFIYIFHNKNKLNSQNCIGIHV